MNLKFAITIQGRGGHGSRPDLSHNPVDCFASLFPLLERLGCQVEWVEGGTTGNIIPDKLHFGGSCQEAVWDAVEQAAHATCKNYHCSATLQKRGMKE